MATSHWRNAVVAFEKHLGTLDWSHSTPGRNRILEAFLRLATENGFNSVSMRMIAKDVNIKAPSLYAHFEGGRDEIVAESLRWHFHRFGTAILEEIRNVEDPLDGWRRMVKVHVGRQLELPESNLWDLLVATDKFVGFLAPELRAELDQWVDEYESLYRAAAEDMGYGLATQQVRLVMTIIEGVNRWAGWDGKARTLAATVQTATSVSLELLARTGD